MGLDESFISISFGKHFQSISSNSITKTLNVWVRKRVSNRLFMVKQRLMYVETNFYTLDIKTTIKKIFPCCIFTSPARFSLQNAISVCFSLIFCLLKPCGLEPSGQRAYPWNKQRKLLVYENQTKNQVEQISAFVDSLKFSLYLWHRMHSLVDSGFMIILLLLPPLLLKKKSNLNFQDFWYWCYYPPILRG